MRKTASYSKFTNPRSVSTSTPVSVRPKIKFMSLCLKRKGILFSNHKNKNQQPRRSPWYANKPYSLRLRPTPEVRQEKTCLVRGQSLKPWPKPIPLAKQIEPSHSIYYQISRQIPNFKISWMDSHHLKLTVNTILPERPFNHWRRYP
jgi:hypothetical protein